MDLRNYILTEKEFLLMAASVGMTELWGFSIQDADPDRDEVILALQELVGRGFMENVNGKFAPAGEMEEIFATIKDEQLTLEARKRSGKACIFYIADRAVRVAPSAARREAYEVALMDTDSVWDCLKDEGWIHGNLSARRLMAQLD